MPLSVDIEDGYAQDPGAVAALARELVALQLAGINLEDGLGTPERLASKIAAIRADAACPGLLIAGEALGVPLDAFYSALAWSCWLPQALVLELWLRRPRH